MTIIGIALVLGVIFIFVQIKIVRYQNKIYKFSKLVEINDEIKEKIINFFSHFKLKSECLGPIQTKRHNNFTKVFLKIGLDYRFLILSFLFLCGGLLFFSNISTFIQNKYLESFHQMIQFRQSLTLKTINQTNKLIEVLYPFREIEEKSMDTLSVKSIDYY